MITVKYISGVNKKEIILNRDYEIAIKEGNPHKSKWTYESVEKRFGIKITSFKKEPIELEFRFRFRGSEKKISENLNVFFEECELDIINTVPGKLYFNDEYLQGFFIERETEGSEEFYGYEQRVVFLSPHPFYIKEIKKEFLPETGGGAGEFLNYPYKYLYDYSIREKGKYIWNTGHYAPSEFDMTIHGPCVDPRILIEGYVYEVFDTLEEEEYIKIDSRNNTVIKYRTNGTTVNLFPYRRMENSIFKPIPGGTVTLNWNGEFGFDITLLTERSELKWN